MTQRQSKDKQLTHPECIRKAIQVVSLQ